MADAWELPDPPGIISGSSDSGSDSDSDSSSSASSGGESTSSTELIARLAPAPCVRAARRGRGRPRGQGGTQADRARRDRLLAARGLLALLPDEAPPAAPAPVADAVTRFGYDIVPRSAVYHGCAAVVPVLGQRVAGALADLPSSSVDAAALVVSEYVVGEEPLPTMGSRGLITGFGCKSGDYRGLRRKLVRLGSSFVHCSLAMANGILGDFKDMAERGIAEPVCVSIFDMYDETPLRLRTKDDTAGESSLPGVSKVVQSELDIAVLMLLPPEAGSAEGTYVSTVLKMPCPLSVVDRGTGECLKAAIDINRLHLPNLRALISLCKYEINACTADRSNANDRAEDGKYAELPSALRARLPCFAHAAHTCQGRIMNPIHFEISGCISGSAVMDNASVKMKLRGRLSTVLRLGVRVLDAPPLRPSHPAMRHLEQLLSLCLEESEDRGDRGAMLRRCLTADIEADDIVWRVQGGADHAAIKKWADDLAWALLPKLIKTVHKSRWLNGVYPQTQWGLLGNVWHLLRRGGSQWLEGLGAKLPSKRKAGAAAAPARSSWDLPSNGAAQLEQQVVPAAAEEASEAQAPPSHALANIKQADPSKAWADFNKQNKISAKAFFESATAPARLVVGSICSAAGVLLLHLVERISSEGWQNDAAQECLEGGLYRCRLAEACRFEARMLKHLDAYFSLDYEPWLAVPRRGRTLGNAALAFSMLATSCCSMEVMVFRTARGALFLLFQLPCKAVEERLPFAKWFFAQPLCSMEHFVRRFLGLFPTPEKLCSSEAIAILLLLGQHLRFEICRVECHNALLRRLAKTGDTWAQDLEQASALFVLSCARGRDRALVEKQAKKRGPKPERRLIKKGKCAGKATGGGGAERYLVGHFLQGRRYGPRGSENSRANTMKAAHAHAAAVRAADGPEWREAVRLGEAGTAAHAAGGNSFKIRYIAAKRRNLRKRHPKRRCKRKRMARSRG